MDKYGAGQDSYCYPGTDVLKNRLGITDEAALADAERDITTLAADEIEFQSPPYDLATFQHIHKQLFQDVYDWAGEIRSVDISKGNTRFCNVQRIQPEAEKLFNRLAEKDWFEGMPRQALIKEVADLYGELNMVHPFREGNGRAQRVLFEFLVVNAGYEISWEPVSEDEWLEANIRAALAVDMTGLERIFEKCIGTALEE